MNFAHAEVATLDPTTMRTLCEEYIANNYIDPETSERLGVKRGLRNPDGTGVLAGLTNVCDVVGYKKDQEGHVIPTPGKLIYRGVNINEIVEEAYRNDRFVFEEVIWLLLFGSLPTQEQLDDFCEILAEHRALPEGFMDTMNAPSPNIMNKLQRCRYRVWQPRCPCVWHDPRAAPDPTVATGNQGDAPPRLVAGRSRLYLTSRSSRTKS